MLARFVSGVTEVPQEAWDRLVGDGSPFFEWTFLRACEEASALPEFGIVPQHVTVWEDEALVGALPLYVKGDGRAEFIYDWSWYVLAERLGCDYYPKAVSMAPFTPVPGAHFFVDPAHDRAKIVEIVAALVEDWARASDLHGVHYLFVTPEEGALLEGEGHLRRLTFQLAWDNDGYTSFDDFLARFRSKDRVKIRRELRRLDEQELKVEIVTGDDLGEEHLEAMYGFYSRTCMLYGTGSHYLQRGTWERLFKDWRHRLVLVLARRDAGYVAGSLFVNKGDDLYGRYWGARQELPSLYFNLSYYKPLELAIERGWRRLYAGSGTSRYKEARGLSPVPTHSIHRVFDPHLRRVLAAHVEMERGMMEARMESMRACSRLKPR